MACYRVKFFKTLLSSDGHSFKCLQRVIDVSDAENSGDAIRLAWLQGDPAKKLMPRYWADSAEAELIDTIATQPKLPPHLAPPLVESADHDRASPRPTDVPLAKASDTGSS